RLHRLRRRLEISLFGDLHAARRGNRESGLHRLVVSTDAGAPRRDLLAGAGATLAAGAAVVLAGCGNHAQVPRHAVKTAPPRVLRRDIAILNAALYLERRTVAAYTAGIPLLSRSQAKACKQF